MTSLMGSPAPPHPPSAPSPPQAGAKGVDGCDHASVAYRHPSPLPGEKVPQADEGFSLGALFAAVLITLFFPTIASACPVCFGDPNSAMVKGANNGILVLLGIVVFVQLGLVALFWSFWRRGQALRRRREQFHLISGGVR